MVAKTRRTFRLEVGVSLADAQPHDFVLFTQGEKKGQRGLIADVGSSNLQMFAYDQESKIIDLLMLACPEVLDYEIREIKLESINQWIPEEGKRYDILYKKLQEDGLICQ